MVLRRFVTRAPMNFENSYILPSVKNSFILVRIKQTPNYRANSKDLDRILVYLKNEPSVEEINNTSSLLAKEFKSLPDYQKYIFLLTCNGKYTKSDLNTWIDLFNSINSDNAYNAIVSTDDIDLIRIKKDLVPFI